MTHRAATQHGRSSLAIAAGPASLHGESSTNNSGAGSLSHRSSKRDFAVILAAEGTHAGDSVPRATRKQLDQFFTTLNKTYIAAQQNCDETDACICEDQVRYAGWVGYCYYTEEDARCLAAEGSLDLTCGTCGNRTPFLEVAQTVYDTARACGLPIEYSYELTSSKEVRFEIAGFDPEEFAEEFAYLKEKRNLFGTLFSICNDEDDFS